SPGTNQRAGFAIVVHDDDASIEYVWGSDEVDEDMPSTWGHVDVPEFSVLIGAAATIGIVHGLRRRRMRSRQPLNSVRRMVRR
ncbi:MAG TPA: hypothetical protein VIL58_04855, partial [Thermoplasmata archaeon]